MTLEKRDDIVLPNNISIDKYTTWNMFGLKKVAFELKTVEY